MRLKIATMIAFEGDQMANNKIDVTAPVTGNIQTETKNKPTATKKGSSPAFDMSTDFGSDP